MTDRPCLTPDCQTGVYARELCSMHYRQFMRGELVLPNAAEEAAGQAGSLEWQENAACRSVDPETFFPISEKPDNPQVIRARAVCARCPVVLRCAEWALSTAMPDGIFGGITGPERRRIRTAAKVSTRQQQEAGVR